MSLHWTWHFQSENVIANGFFFRFATSKIFLKIQLCFAIMPWIKMKLYWNMSWTLAWVSWSEEAEAEYLFNYKHSINLNISTRNNILEKKGGTLNLNCHFKKHLFISKSQDECCRSKILWASPEFSKDLKFLSLWRERKKTLIFEICNWPQALCMSEVIVCNPHFCQASLEPEPHDLTFTSAEVCNL